VSFVLTAFLALVASMVGLVFGTISTTHNNWADQSFSDFVRKRLVRSTDDNRATKEFWRNVIEAAVLNFSDQPLVTGGAILIVAYIQLATISVYHFTVVMDLAWFSSNTHLLAVVVLRKHFREHFFRRAWRGWAMSIMCGLLFISSIIQGHWNWYGSYRCPTICLIKQLITPSNIGGVPARWMFTNLAMLSWGYATALIPLFDRSRNAWKKLKDWVCDLFDVKDLSPSNNPRQHWTIVPIWIYMILSSTVFDMAFQIMWWGIGVWSILDDKLWGASALAISGQSENVWAFGQIVPFLLVALPLLLSAEAYFGNAHTIVLMI
jgi:hypothetical protein